MCSSVAGFEMKPSSLVKNWEAEFNKWLGRERIAVSGIDGSASLNQYFGSFFSCSGLDRIDFQLARHFGMEKLLFASDNHGVHSAGADVFGNPCG